MQLNNRLLIFMFHHLFLFDMSHWSGWLLGMWCFNNGSDWFLFRLMRSFFLFFFLGVSLRWLSCILFGHLFLLLFSFGQLLFLKGLGFDVLLLFFKFFELLLLLLDLLVISLRRFILSLRGRFILLSSLFCDLSLLGNSFLLDFLVNLLLLFLFLTDFLINGRISLLFSLVFFGHLFCVDHILVVKDPCLILLIFFWIFRRSGFFFF